jgi:hypothetical protein
MLDNRPFCVIGPIQNIEETKGQRKQLPRPFVSAEKKQAVSFMATKTKKQEISYKAKMRKSNDTKTDYQLITTCKLFFKIH